MSVNLAIEEINLFALIFCRCGGMIFFNPLLSRKNIPNQFKAALVLGMAVLITPTITTATLPSMEGISLLFAMIKELLIGICFGFLFQIYYYMLFVAGDVIDMGFGLSMAKAFDPATHIQLSLSGNFFQLMFVVYFFITDCHLVFIRLIISTFDLVGLGGYELGSDVGQFICTQFVYAFGLIMHLALPFVAASFILEITMGILMKLIPQINVFSIHFQFKILLGFSLLFLFAAPTTEFIQSFINDMFTQMSSFIKLIQ